MHKYSISPLLFLLLAQTVKALVEAATTSLPNGRSYSNLTGDSVPELKRRQQSTFVSICGYKNGDPNQPRTANSGFDCRVDTQHALWGFCPTTVIAATDCGLAGNCIDAHSCSGGCGIVGTPGITTFTCTASGGDYCSTALLTAGPDQTYSYLACAQGPATVHLLAAPTVASPGSTATQSSATRTWPSSSSSSSSTLLSLSSTSSLIASITAPSLSSSTTSMPSMSDWQPNNNVGAIVGGVIGGLALIAFVVLAIIFLRRYQRGYYNGNVLGPTAVPLRDTQGSLRPDADFYGRYSTAKDTYGRSPVELSTQHPQSPFELSS